MKSLCRLAIFGAALAAGAAPALAGKDPFVGEIMMTAAQACPEGWAEADGRVLNNREPVAHQVLFQLYGTTFGGDGIETFGLPDLRGRAITGEGVHKYLGEFRMGQFGELVGPFVDNSKDKTGQPTNAPATAHPTRQYLVVRYCIALQGTYPTPP